MNERSLGEGGWRGNAETWACPVCGVSDRTAYQEAIQFALTVEGTGVCEGCARRIANCYHMRRSGQWLDWPNPPAAKKAKVVIGRELQRQVFERDAYRCVTCAAHIDLTCDHVIPESKGGPTTFENLRTMCRPCNSRKGAKPLDGLEANRGG